MNSQRNPLNAEFEQLWHEYYPRVQRAALVLCGNPWDADDLAQEAFLVLAAQKSRFEGRSQLFTWLYGILLNLERRERRRRNTNLEKLTLLFRQSRDRVRAAPPASARAEMREWQESLWSRVALLPDGQRQALVLRFSEGLPYHQIAEILDCPLGTVKSRIFHGLANLKQIVAQPFEPRPNDASYEPPKLSPLTDFRDEEYPRAI